MRIKEHWILWAVLFIYVWFSGTMAKPAGSLGRSSSLCRSRRSIVPASPQSPRAQLPAHTPHPSHTRHAHLPQLAQHSLTSDPDILSVSSCPVLYRSDEEEEAIYFSAEKQWYWQWMNYRLCWRGVVEVGVGGGGVACNTQFLVLSSVCQSPSMVWLGFLPRVWQG